MKRKLILLPVLLAALTGFSAEYYVDASRPDDSGSAISWASAKQTIQAAVDLTRDGDTVWVTNGTYVLSSKISVTNAIAVQSANGSDVTIVSGNSSNSCFVLSNACDISGLTIKNGKAIEGGGICCSSGGPVVSNCVITGNRATSYGGGVFRGQVENCEVFGNSAFNGGGLYSSQAFNSLVYSNTANSGGGAYNGTLVNCTVVGNKAYHMGCGAFGSHVQNCIVWDNDYNIYSIDVAWATVSSSCIPGLGQVNTSGDDRNITSDPLLSTFFRATPKSPCRGAGSSNYVVGVDLDGKEWLSPPSMGCYEYGGRGWINVGLISPSQLVQGVPGEFHAQIDGAATEYVLDFGDGQVTNTVDVSYGWDVAGNHQVVLTAFNDEYTAGISVTQDVQVVTAAESAVYISSATGSDENDGSSWLFSKKTIQAGVDAQQFNGGWVLVSNGLYKISQQIVIDHDVHVVGITGADRPIIDGQGVTRCFSLESEGCSVQGLTISNGYTTGSGGGVYCSHASARVVDCIVIGNSALQNAGGMRSGTAESCVFKNNVTRDLYQGGGGGKQSGVTIRCSFIGNLSVNGGGVNGGTVRSCYFARNRAQSGGGMAFGDAYNSTFFNNQATEFSGGGMVQGSANNCIFWDNKSPKAEQDHDHYCQVSYSRSSDVTHGVNGNITNAPMMVSVSHIATNSPCRGAGSPLFSDGVDVDGEVWLNPPSMGCDEYSGEGSLLGGVQIVITGPTNIITGIIGNYSLVIDGSIYESQIDFGDGEAETNALDTAHSWAQPGTYDLIITAFNDSYPQSFSVTQAVQVLVAEDIILYVSCNAGSDVNNGRSWERPKETIQAAVDEQLEGGIVIVDDGTYSLDAEVLVSKEVHLQSQNGSDVTVVDGGQNVRCFNLGNTKSSLDGFTVQNGVATGVGVHGCGGGVYCSGDAPQVFNCLLLDNAAETGGGMHEGAASNSVFKGSSGGGMRLGTATDCIFQENSGHGKSFGTAVRCGFYKNEGAGMSGGIAKSCYFFGNTGLGMTYGASYNSTFSNNKGGGVTDCDIYNCIVWDNGLRGQNNSSYSTAQYCCSPSLTHGVNGNITNAPLFVSGSHISTNSPCRNAGNIFHVLEQDIDGEEWLSPPSMGCDEYHGAGTVMGMMDLLLDGPDRVCVGFPSSYRMFVEGGVLQTQVDFGDGHVATNALQPMHVWDEEGIYPVVLTAFNDTFSQGIFVTNWVTVGSMNESAIYVSTQTGNDSNNGTEWTSAKRTIQAGVDAQSSYGGAVFVSNGTYNLSTEIVIGTLVQVIGVSGRDATIVDGGNSVRCFNLGSTVCRLRGLTITRGNCEYGHRDEYGGGVRCTTLDPQIEDCRIVSCVGQYGGGVSYGTLKDCEISYNSGGDINDSSDGGGGYYSDVENCTFVSNSTTFSGGGLYSGRAKGCTFKGNYTLSASSSFGGGGMWSGSADHCVFDGNYSARGGGMLEGESTASEFVNNRASAGAGMYGGRADECWFAENEASSAGGGKVGGTAQRCIFTNNVAGSGGGMSGGTVFDSLFVNNSATHGGGVENIEAAGCIIRGNRASESGGGVYDSYVESCLIWSNHSDGFGGGIGFSGAVNCTIVNNDAEEGGGVESALLVNSIVYDNHASISGGNYQDSLFYESCSPNLSTADDSGNIRNDPEFVNAEGGDFRLQIKSPCINAGDNDVVVEIRDVSGNPRINDGSVDLGAYEFYTSYNDLDGDGLSNDEEERIGSDPLLSDTDDDGITDGVEIQNGTDPLIPDRKPVKAMPWINLLLLDSSSGGGADAGGGMDDNPPDGDIHDNDIPGTPV